MKMFFEFKQPACQEWALDGRHFWMKYVEGNEEQADKLISVKLPKFTVKGIAITKHVQYL